MSFTIYTNKLINTWHGYLNDLKQIFYNKQAFFVLLGLGFLFLPEIASADIGSSLQAGYNLLTSKIARGIAVLAIAAVGFSCFTGKMAWKWGVLICLGIGIVFSAPDIADLLGAGGS